MENYDFSIQNEQALSKTKDYVVLQAGKGRGKNTSINYNAIEFSYVEGLIWDKYREYGNKRKTKISSSDWERILTGFKPAIAQLNEYQEGNDLADILRFEIINPVHPINNIKNYTVELGSLLSELVQWVTDMVKEEKYILIMKQHE